MNGIGRRRYLLAGTYALRRSANAAGQPPAGFPFIFTSARFLPGRRSPTWRRCGSTWSTAGSACCGGSISSCASKA